MADDFARIYLVNGEKVDLPGSVPDVHALVNSAGGGMMQVEDQDGRSVVVNVQHITHIVADRSRTGAASF